MRRWLLLLAASTFAVVAVPAAPAGADHDPPEFAEGVPASTAFHAGGEGATWELVTSFPTGNPHTDLDFFTQGDDTYVAVGTLAAGPNGGGQSIFRLQEGDALAPAFVAGHPSAECGSNPLASTGLQHDVEATPKGDVLTVADNPFAARSDAQLLLDATDAAGRCHDQSPLGLTGSPRGGIEIIDITDIGNPVEIGLVSHIGQSHTVNVDPKRPHIAFSVSSDSVGVDENGNRANENPDSSARFGLDGFEVLDLSSCMNFPDGTTVAEKRDACRPDVYRFRYPSAGIGLGHTARNAVAGCHELEITPDDLLTCAAIEATILFDMAGAFDDGGTPDDYTDDTPNGTPMPCRARPSVSTGPVATGAMVTDCVEGEEVDGEPTDLTVPGWLAIGAPALEGVEHVGTAHHQGRSAGEFPSAEDIEVSHEAELTASGRFLLATDERGGGVVPAGATCSPGVDNPDGNGGMHAYRVDALDTDTPASAEEAHEAYALTPGGDRAVYRATPRVPAATFCTAHVFQQIPGQNRIFMGWYTQGTQVVDFEEHADGTIEFREAGFFIPENANTWTSHVFDVEENDDGTFTYLGATGDFNLGYGRSAVDVYRVTLPAPPEPLVPDDGDGGDGEDPPDSGVPEPPDHSKGHGRDGAPGNQGEAPGQGQGAGAEPAAHRSAVPDSPVPLEWAAVLLAAAAVNLAVRLRRRAVRHEPG